MTLDELGSLDLMLKSIEIDIEGLSVELKHFLSIYYIRTVELKIASEYSHGLMRTPVHLCVGQESIPVGLSEHLFPRDKVLSNHRSHGHYLAKGGDLIALFGELLGKQIGCAGGRGGSQHLIDLSANFIASAPILGGTVPIAAGVAFSNKLRKVGGIVVVYLGDAVLEEGVLYETISFASLHSLPVLFVIENNRLSVHTHISKRQPPRKFRDIGLAFNLKSDEFDGSDIMSVSQMSKIFIDYVREYSKPALLSFETFRRLEHVGPQEDYSLGYRDQGEIEYWLAKDPLDISYKKIARKSDQSVNIITLQSKIENYVDTAWNFALNSEMAK